MKSFAASIILFAIMSLAIATNSIYIDNVTDTLKEMASRLPQEKDCTDQVGAIVQYWRDNLNTVSISVNFHETEAITEAIFSMQAYAHIPASPEFQYAKTVFLETLSEIALGEKISISNII